MQKLHMCEKDYNWNPSTCICKNSKYLKSAGDNSVTKCDEILNVMDNTARKNTNVTKSASINCHRKKIRYCYKKIRDFHTVLLAMILLLKLLSFAIIMQNKKV